MLARLTNSWLNAKPFSIKARRGAPISSKKPNGPSPSSLSFCRPSPRSSCFLIRDPALQAANRTPSLVLLSVSACLLLLSFVSALRALAIRGGQILHLGAIIDGENGDFPKLRQGVPRTGTTLLCHDEHGHQRSHCPVREGRACVGGVCRCYICVRSSRHRLTVDRPPGTTNPGRGGGDRLTFAH